MGDGCAEGKFLKRSHVQALNSSSLTWAQCPVIFSDLSWQDRGLTFHPQPALGSVLLRSVSLSTLLIFCFITAQLLTCPLNDLVNYFPRCRDPGTY